MCEDFLLCFLVAKWKLLKFGKTEEDVCFLTTKITNAMGFKCNYYSCSIAVHLLISSFVHATVDTILFISVMYSCYNFFVNNCSDGIHLSAEGSKVVVEEIMKVLKEAEWEPSLHWKSMPTEHSEDSPYDLVAADGKTTINPSEWTYHREIQWD